MFGFYYALTGLIFGIAVSRLASKKGGCGEDWFIIGFILNLPALLLLKYIYREKEGEKIIPTAVNAGF